LGFAAGRGRPSCRTRLRRGFDTLSKPTGNCDVGALMKLRHSASLILVWRVAEFEARHLNASTIEPAHLLLGLCKVVDLDLPELVSKDAPDRNEILEELLREVRRLRTIFRVAGVDAKTLRRRLRRTSRERRFSFDESERLRRGRAAKIAFTDAEHFAELGNCAVYPVHLLYASLLAEDKDRDARFAELKIDRKRLLSVTKREVLTFQVDPMSGTKGARARWN
jgi:Clp amino terminal domain, pathogenicity island component